MNADNTQKLAMLTLCLMCLLPMVAGGFLGAWMERRKQSTGSLLAAFLPDFIRNWLDRR